MHGFFKFLLILGVIAGIAGFLWPQIASHPTIASFNLPPNTNLYLSFGGLGIIVLALAGRQATAPEPSNEGEWK